MIHDSQNKPAFMSVFCSYLLRHFILFFVTFTCTFESLFLWSAFELSIIIARIHDIQSQIHANSVFKFSQLFCYLKHHLKVTDSMKGYQSKFLVKTMRRNFYRNGNKNQKQLQPSMFKFSKGYSKVMLKYASVLFLFLVQKQGELQTLLHITDQHSVNTSIQLLLFKDC